MTEHDPHRTPEGDTVTATTAPETPDLHEPPEPVTADDDAAPPDDTAVPPTDDGDTTDTRTPDPEPDDDSGQLGKLRREAAGWRTRLRGTEVERDTLRGHVEALQRAAVLAAATGPGRLRDGGDLFRDGEVTLDGLIAEDGTVDLTAVTAAVDGVAERHPHWKAPTPSPLPRRPGEGGSFSGSDPLGHRGASWGQVINPRP